MRLIFPFIVLFVLTAPVLADECSPCHDVRHGMDLCVECHTDAGVVGDGHETPPSDLMGLHFSFDWEDDDAAEAGQEPAYESCPACHKDLMDMRRTNDNINVCEDCHLEDSRGPFTREVGFTLRSDINGLIPRVYAHYTGSKKLEVSDQSTGDGLSTCFGWDPKTEEGTCHGVERTTDRKYYAHNLNFTKPTGNDPYTFNGPADNMPQTSDCLFCHAQKDSVLWRQWGSAKAPGSKCDSSSNERCWECHAGGEQPKTFHDGSLYVVKSPLAEVGEAFRLPAGGMIIVAVFLGAIAVLGWRLRRR